MNEDDLQNMGVYAPKTKGRGHRQLINCNRRADGSIVEPMQFWTYPKRTSINSVSIEDFLRWASHRVTTPPTVTPAKAGPFSSAV